MMGRNLYFKGKINKKLVLTLFLLMVISSVLVIAKKTIVTEAITESSTYTSITESFEGKPYNGWTFVHPEHYTPDYFNVKDGLRSLKAKGLLIGGITYDGVVYQQEFTDGGIEGWVRTTDDIVCPAIWIRIQTIDFDDSTCSFKDAYMFRLYNNEAQIWYRDQNGDFSLKDSMYIGDIENQWFHMKLQTEGNNIYARVENENEDSWELNCQSTSSLGRTGFSARTNRFLKSNYFDDLVINYKISIYNEGFEENLIDWNIPDSSRFQIDQRSYPSPQEGTKMLKIAGETGKLYDVAEVNSFQMDEFANGTIEAWTFAKASNYLRPCLWIRTNGWGIFKDPTLNEGYFLRLNVDKVSLMRFYGGNFKTYDNQNIGYIGDKWWHMKLQVTGNLLEGWVTSVTGDTHYLHADLTKDEQIIEEGRAGISGRTNIGWDYETFFDAVRIYDQYNEENLGFYKGRIKNELEDEAKNVQVNLIENNDNIVKSVYSDSEGYYYLGYKTNPQYNYKLKVSKDGSEQTLDVQTATTEEEVFTNFNNLNEICKFAVIVAIERYNYGTDDPGGYADANNWFEFFSTTLDFDRIWVYGDNYPEEYTQYDGEATPSNIADATRNMADNADSNDIIAFIYKGHGGNGVITTTIWLDKIRDDELAEYLEPSLADRIFVYIHACQSAGMLDDLMNMDNKEHVLAISSSLVGEDSRTNSNGGHFTRDFLLGELTGGYGLITQCVLPIEAIFGYVFDNADYPGDIDGMIGYPHQNIGWETPVTPTMEDGDGIDDNFYL